MCACIESVHISFQDDGLYDLFAVVAHSGKAKFGHYCAYIRSFTDHRWYCFNDSSVCKVRQPDRFQLFPSSHQNIPPQVGYKIQLKNVSVPEMRNTINVA